MHMNHRFRTIAALTLTTTLAATASAQDWYVSADLGLNLLGDQTLTYEDGTGTPGTRNDAGFDPSFAAGGRVGRYFGERFRLEGELMYRTNGLEDVTVQGLGEATDGNYASLGIGLSALVDFNLFGSDRYRTYLGAGIVLIEEIDIDFTIDGQETSFQTNEVAAQLQAGVRYDTGDRWFVDVGLRYLISDDVALERPDNALQRVTAGYDPLTITAGVGLRF